MIPQWIIEKKRDGLALNEGEISDFIGRYTQGEIPDYQMAALAMAIYFRGMDADETAAMTRAMLASGSAVDTTTIAAPKIDKHSTGGIGDKVSLVLAPLAACCGIAVPMIAGRGLGITGGTLDKLESIPGYRTRLSEREFVGIVEKCGCSIVAQTDELVPADRKLYALRDVTGTVPSVPLIVASIMSKKLAAGLDGLVLDVKCGSGAFMKSRAEARVLAASLMDVGRRMGKAMAALITDMEQPLGLSAGNALEVAEAVATLSGHGPPDLVEITVRLCSRMLRLAGLARGSDGIETMLTRKLASGEALARFRDMVRLHGGDVSVIDDPRRLPSAKRVMPAPAPECGFVCGADADKIGRACLLLGAGRTRTTDAVDHSVGVAGIRKIGERIEKGQPLAVVHANSEDSLTGAMELVASAFAVGERPPARCELVLEEM